MGTLSSSSRSAEFSDDCQTALRVAEAIFEPVFGIREVDKWRPYNAQLDKNGLWTVYGTSRQDSGEERACSISKRDGRVLEVWHSM
jgi:hypothetical protein